MSLSLIMGLLFGMAVGGPLYYFYITHKAKRRQELQKRDRQSRSSMKKDEEQEEQEEQGK